jgi:hypothetical protein
MPNSMPVTEGQGATTAASLFGVFKEAFSDDDSVFIDLLFVICCLLLLFGIISTVNNKKHHSFKKKTMPKLKPMPRPRNYKTDTIPAVPPRQQHVLYSVKAVYPDTSTK